MPGGPKRRGREDRTIAQQRLRNQRLIERIAAEIGERWPSARLALHHRIGRARREVATRYGRFLGRPARVV